MIDGLGIGLSDTRMENPPVVDPKLQNVLFFVLDILSSKVFESVLAALKKFNISPRHFVILCLLEDRAMNQQELADAIHVGRNAMVQLIDQLEDLEMVQRKVNPQNRREHNLYITSKGKRTLENSKKSVDNQQQSFLATLPQIERKRFLEILVSMY